MDAQLAQMQFLPAHGTNPNQPDDHGRTVLFHNNAAAVVDTGHRQAYLDKKDAKKPTFPAPPMTTLAPRLFNRI